MAEKGIHLTPTLSCYGIMVRKPFEDFLPPSGKVKNSQVMKQGLNALKVSSSASNGLDGRAEGLMVRSRKKRV